MSNRFIKPMTSFNPHLFRAFYEWLVENQITPHLVVRANVPGVEVPLEYVHQNMIILSISPTATRNFNIDRDGISFTARFHGMEELVVVPYKAMQELFAVETSQSYPIDLWLTDTGNDGLNTLLIPGFEGMEEGEHAPEDQQGGAQFAPLKYTGKVSTPDKNGSAERPSAEKDEPLPSFSVLPKNKE